MKTQISTRTIINGERVNDLVIAGNVPFMTKEIALSMYFDKKIEKMKNVKNSKISKKSPEFDMSI